MKMSRPIAPAIRFPEFQESWETKPIEQILKKRSKAVSVEPDTQYVQIGLRSHGKGIFYKQPVTGKSLGNKRVFWVQRDCLVVNIVFAWEQAVGKTTEREEGLIASHRFPMYAPRDEEADIDFIVRFFLRPRGKHLLGLASPGGAGRNRTLGQKEFDKLKVVVPTLAEQRKIADFLTAVDGRIGQLIEKKALLEQYKKGVMQQLFAQTLRFKDDQGNPFPDWEEKKLGDLGDFTGGGTPDTGNTSFWDGNIPWISSSDILESSISRIKIHRFITKMAIKESATKLVPKNSILFISRVGVGKLAICKEEVCTSQDFTNFTPQKDNIEYLGYYFVFNQKLLKRYAQGTSIKGITSKELKKISVARPSFPEQTKIAVFLSALDRKIEQVAGQIAETQTFKRGLLQQMFV
jgi:type I restriction enzyme S subunit